MIGSRALRPRDFIEIEKEPPSGEARLMLALIEQAFADLNLGMSVKVETWHSKRGREDYRDRIKTEAADDALDWMMKGNTGKITFDDACSIVGLDADWMRGQIKRGVKPQQAHVRNRSYRTAA
jgi:hypothetical protein